MSDDSPSAHTPMSQWLRPGNAAFVLGGVVGIVALASDLRSRVVKGLGIASAAVSILFGVYDRTKTERLTWPTLWVMLWKPCRSGQRIVRYGVRRTTRIQVRNEGHSGRTSSQCPHILPRIFGHPSGG
ncbi:hypothetical protein EXIGLDRAFT_99517 [Exidia glandulosa HHB12029]|uniref:Uncharacterized protein n=1 Tax=Exidia glandulosa HHB12029 TaxID=1314781 RepID=A0A165NQF5_EXIGL|nr:hypothetical protein EXIGLDRAFT_99517 [Exidia glandulosa HHB12029]